MIVCPSGDEPQIYPVNCMRTKSPYEFFSWKNIENLIELKLYQTESTNAAVQK